MREALRRVALAWWDCHRGQTLSEAFIAGADWHREQIVEYLKDYRKAYAEDIFPPQDMEQYEPDARTACAGFMGRFVLDNCIKEIQSGEDNTR